MDWYYHHRKTLFYLEWIRHDFDRYSRHISSRCVKYRCSGSWRTLDGKMVTFSNKCCNNIPSCLSSWWRWGQCPGWRGRSCARSRHSTPPAHAGHSGAPLPWKRLYLDFWVHYCEAQGKGRAKGRPRKVTQRSFMDGGWWLVVYLSLMLYTKFGCHHHPQVS